MIYLPEKRLTIITPYKCGSTSLHEMLCRPKYGGVYTIGPQPGGEIDKHTFHLPWHSRGGTVVVVVRDPYRRIASLWHQAKLFLGAGDFDEWLRGDFWSDERNKPIATCLSEHGLSDIAYWQLENIQNCLASIGVDESLQVLNQSQSFLLNESQRESIAEWANVDALAFGYSQSQEPSYAGSC